MTYPMLRTFQGLPTAFRESLALHHGSPDAANLASALFSELASNFLFNTSHSSWPQGLCTCCLECSSPRSLITFPFYHSRLRFSVIFFKGTSSLPKVHPFQTLPLSHYFFHLSASKIILLNKYLFIV